MRAKSNIESLMDRIQIRTNREVSFDRTKILHDFELDHQQDNFIIKILSVLGGLLATIAFFGFLMVSGLYDSEIGLLICGPLFIGAAIGIQRISYVLIVDTICVCSFLVGFVLLGLGMGKNNVDENMICFVFIAFSITSLFIMQNYILSFVAFIIFVGNIFALMLVNEFFHGINFLVSILAILVTFLFLNEAKIISRRVAFNSLYRPIRIGLIISFLVGLFLISKSNLFWLPIGHVWVPALVNIASTIYLLSKICQVLHVYEKKKQILIYVSAFLILIPTVFYPIISGSILIILLSFYVNYKTGLVLGIITFIYFIGQYYYDLHFTLLTKSMLLIATGILFLILYFFTHQKLKADEKI